MEKSFIVVLSNNVVIKVHLLGGVYSTSLITMSETRPTLRIEKRKSVLTFLQRVRKPTKLPM